MWAHEYSKTTLNDHFDIKTMYVQRTLIFQLVFNNSFIFQYRQEKASYEKHTKLTLTIYPFKYKDYLLASKVFLISI